MLLHAGTDVTRGSDLTFAAEAALQGHARHEGTERAAGSRNAARLFSPQHSVDWVRDRRVWLDPGLPPGFRHLALAAARAAVETDARFAARPAEGHRPLRRSEKTSNIRRSIGRRVHEPKVLCPPCLSCNDTTTQPGVLTSGGRRLSESPCRSAKTLRLRRRDNPNTFRELRAPLISQPSYRGSIPMQDIMMNWHRQPICGSVNRPSRRNLSPKRRFHGGRYREPASGSIDLAVWFTWHRSG